jgi:hypothetical protein
MCATFTPWWTAQHVLQSGTNEFVSLGREKMVICFLSFATWSSLFEMRQSQRETKEKEKDDSDLVYKWEIEKMVKENWKEQSKERRREERTIATLDITVAI